MKSVGELIQERKKKFNTLDNTSEMFPVGSTVQVITLGQDMYFFKGTEIGVVVKNSEKYLGIRVKFDKPRKFEDGYIQTEFGFDPSDLKLITQLKDDERNCDACDNYEECFRNM
jgi:hypothetical protein